MSTPRALVVGLGIAGMSAAIGLRQAGWEPVIIERAPTRRTGGYFIGLFPEGLQAAAELGVLEAIHQRTPVQSRTWEVRRDGTRHRSVGFLDQDGRPAGVLRGDIEAGLWEQVQGQVQVRYGTTVVAVDDADDADGPGDDADGTGTGVGTGQVHVQLQDTTTGQVTAEAFDLVVGADGVRSTVRSLVFGPHERYMRSWSSVICAFQLQQQVPGYADRDGLVAAESRRSLWVFPFEDRAPTALLTYRTKDVDAQFTRPAAAVLQDAYAGMGTEAVQHALASLEQAPDHLFDSVHSVKMPTWHRGRVLLLGDAAWCLTLYSGMGATSALRGGALLSQVLQRHPGDLEAALVDWEEQLRPFITRKAREARFKHQVFVPSNPVLTVLRSALMRRVGRRVAAKAALGADLTAPADGAARQRTAAESLHDARR